MSGANYRFKNGSEKGYFPINYYYLFQRAFFRNNLDKKDIFVKSPQTRSFFKKWVANKILLIK